MCETLPADGPAAPVPPGADHAGRGSAGFPPVLSEGNPMVEKKKRRQASAHQKKARRGAGRSVPANPGRGVRTDSHPLAIVGIGASGGGLEAVTRLLKALSPDTGMAFVLVQHLDPKHESLLPELLSKTTSMPVTQVSEGVTLRSNHVYVIPPNVDMALEKGALHLTRRTQTHGLHMPIDRFLRSLAMDRKSRSIGVILSGSASDGTLGLTAIKAEGGITFAQDAESAKYGSMPHSALAAGVVDFVLPPESIAKELARIGRHPFVHAAPAAVVEEGPPEQEDIL